MKDLILGKDYETMETIMEKADLKTKAGFHYRLQKLKEMEVLITECRTLSRLVFWFRDEADKIINFALPKEGDPPIIDSFDKMVLGVDYETIVTLTKKCGFTSIKSYNNRVQKLRRRESDIIRHSDNKSRFYYLREEADKFINIPSLQGKRRSLKFSELTPIPNGFVLGVDYHTMKTIQKKSKYKTKKDFNQRVNNLKIYNAIDLHTKYIDNYTRWWLPVDADIIISYRKKRVNKGKL